MAHYGCNSNGSYDHDCIKQCYPLKSYCTCQRGPQGPPGEPGTPGTPGTPGAPGPGAVIPFASGDNVVLGTTATGVARQVAVIGFGSENGTALITTINTPIVQANPTDIQAFAFVAPRDGTITRVAASAISNSGNETTVDIVARVYIAASNSSTFNPTAAFVQIPTPGLNAVTGGVGATVSVPITAGTRVLLVIYTTDETTEQGNVNVFMNAGITFDATV